MYFKTADVRLHHAKTTRAGDPGSGVSIFYREEGEPSKPIPGMPV